MKAVFQEGAPNPPPPSHPHPTPLTPPPPPTITGALSLAPTGKARRLEANFNRVVNERLHLALPWWLIKITKQSFRSPLMGFVGGGGAGVEASGFIDGGILAGVLLNQTLNSSTNDGLPLPGVASSRPLGTEIKVCVTPFLLLPLLRKEVRSATHEHWRSGAARVMRVKIYGRQGG